MIKKVKFLIVLFIFFVVGINNSFAAPAMPSNISCSVPPINNIVACSWQAVSGATSYELKRNLTSTIYKGPSTIFFDINVFCGMNYIYSVSACDSTGCSAVRMHALAKTNDCPISFGQILSVNTKVTVPTCTWTCGDWGVCSNGNQTRTCTSSPSGCSGPNPYPTTQGCTDVSLTGFKNPLDLVANASTADQKEQCVWCDYYYQDGENIAAGKSGSLNFEFTYNSSNNADMTNYSMILTSSSLDPNVSVIPSNQKIQIDEAIRKSTNSKVSISNILVSRLVNGITNRILPYDNNTYKWWIRVTNANGNSPWIAANRDIVIPSHQWPKPSIGGIVETLSSDNEFLGHTVCSTMADITTKYLDDPCYRSCWQDKDGNGNLLNTKPIVGDASRWKCSVCYNTSGSPVLCDTNSFAWKDISSTIGTFNEETNAYKEKGNTWKNLTNDNTGKQFFNPIIKFVNSASVSNVLKFSIKGSECPLSASVNARTIRPIWVEK